MYHGLVVEERGDGVGGRAEQTKMLEEGGVEES